RPETPRTDADRDQGQWSERDSSHRQGVAAGGGADDHASTTAISVWSATTSHSSGRGREIPVREIKGQTGNPPPSLRNQGRCGGHARRSVFHPARTASRPL